MPQALGRHNQPKALLYFSSLLWRIALLGACLSPRAWGATQDLGQKCETKLRECENLSSQNIQHHDKVPWVCKQVFGLAQKTRLPEQYQQQLELQSASPMVLRDWFLWLHSASGLSLRLTPDAEAKLLGKYQIETGSKKTPSYGGSDSNAKNQEALQDPLMTPIMRQKYAGSAEDFLDLIASELGLSWKYENKSVRFYFLDTRTFKIHAIPSATKISSTMNASATTDGSTSGGSSISSGSGQSNQSTSVEINTDILGDIAKNIEMILTPGIGRYSLSVSTGYVTVSDTEESLDRIANYIERENACITKQVLLNVKVITVQLKDSRQCGLDWKLLFEKLSLGSQGKSSSDAPFLDMTLPIEGQSGLVYDFLNGKLGMKEIGFFMSLLSEQGKVSVLTSPSVTTLNLQPVPLQVAQQQNYVARQTSNTSAESSSNSLEAGTVTSGLSMNLLPFITEDNQILLQYSINLSDLVRMDVVESASGGEEGTATESQSVLQLPVVDNRIFTQKVRMRSGQTLLLAGYEQQKGQSEASSPFPWFSRFLGKNSDSQEHKSTIILITPIILE